MEKGLFFRKLLRGENEVVPRLYPTTVPSMPLWVRPLTLPRALERITIGELKARVIDPTFVEERGLARSLLSPTIPPSLSSLRVFEKLTTEKPLITGEIVEWMQIAGAENVILQQRIEEYNRLGSEMLGNSNDPWLPGCYVEDVGYSSGQTGSGIRTRGLAVATTPRGNFNVPALSKSPGIFSDIISWGGNSYLASYQWTATILKWKSLAKTPITSAVGFYKDYRGNSAPNFFVQTPPRPSLTVTVRQAFSSSDPQSLVMNFRDPTNYARILGTRSVDVAKGDSEVSYTLSAFPYVPPVVTEIQPEDVKDTKLTSYTVA